MDSQKDRRTASSLDPATITRREFLASTAAAAALVSAAPSSLAEEQPAVAAKTAARSIGIQVGFHIEHVNSFNPIFRATHRYEELARLADFLKIVVYNNCGGERFAHFIDNLGPTVFRDVPREELLRFNIHLLGYGTEASMADLNFARDLPA